MNSPDVFLGFGLFCLFLQSYRDLKTGKVDSRKNYVMQGLVLGCVLINDYNIWSYLAIILLAVSFTMLLGKNWGDGDKEIIRWILPGLFVVGFTEMFVFLIALAVCFIAFQTVTRVILKAKGKLPAVPVIFIAFLAATIGYYLPDIFTLLT